MKDKRQEKLAELKTNIGLASEELLAHNMELRILKAKSEEEDRQEEIKAAQLELSQMIAVLSALEEDYKLTKMNKASSSFFEWHPSPPNRRTRRMMAKLR